MGKERELLGSTLPPQGQTMHLSRVQGPIRTKAETTPDSWGKAVKLCPLQHLSYPPQYEKQSREIMTYFNLSYTALDSI